LSIQVPPTAFIGGEHPSKLMIVLQNDGQVKVDVSSIVLVSGPEEHELEGKVYDGITGGGQHKFSRELPPDLEAVRSRIEVRSDTGVIAKVELRLLPVPTLELVSDETHDDEPLVTISEQTESEALAVQEWTAPMRLRVAGRAGEPFELTCLDIQSFDQSFTALGDERNVNGVRSFECQLRVDGYEAEKARDGYVEGSVSMRVKGYPHPIVQPFRVTRRRRAQLQVFKKDLLTEVARQQGSGGLNKVLHGLGRRVNASVGIANQGDMEVEIAGPVTSANPAFRVYNESEHTGIKIPSGVLGLRYNVALQPDEIDFESLPAFGDDETSGASTSRRLVLELEVPIREVGATVDEVSRETLMVTDIIVSLVGLDPDYLLFVDFGTTNTCVAHVRPGADRPEMLDVDETDTLGNLYPSLVNYRDLSSEPYECSFGQFVRDKARIDTQSFLATATEFKPYISDERKEFFYTDDHGRTERVGARSSAETFLKHVFDELKKLKLEAIPAQILLSYPVSFNDGDREALKEVVASAFGGGEDVVVETFQSEPSALLANLLLGDTGMEPDIGESKVIAVFDFGGGTTDLLLTRATRLAAQDYRMEHLGKGVVEAGGERLTREIARAIWPDVKALLVANEQCDASHEWILDGFDPPLDPTRITGLSSAHQGLYSSLITQAEGVKMQYTQLRRAQRAQSSAISEPTESFGSKGYVVPSDATGDSFKGEINLNEAFADGEAVDRAIDDFVRPMLERLFDLEYQKLQKADPDSRVDIVLLAGNSSRLERVRELAEEIFDQEGAASRVHFAGDSHAKEGVVKGLAWWSLCPPDEVIRTFEDLTPFKIALRGSFLGCGQAWRGKLMRGARVAVHETTATGEPKPEPLGRFVLKETVQGAFERLTVVLRVEDDVPLLDVHEFSPEDEPIGEIRATLRPMN
jgi:hypothetical protein